MLFFAIKDGNGEFLSGCFLTVIFLSSIPFPVGTFTFLKVKRHQSLKFKPIFLKFSFKHQIKQTLTNFFVKKINTIKKSEGKKRKSCAFSHTQQELFHTRFFKATASSLTEIPNKQLWIHVNVMKMFQNYSYWNFFSEVSYALATRKSEFRFLDFSALFRQFFGRILVNFQQLFGRFFAKKYWKLWYLSFFWQIICTWQTFSIFQQSFSKHLERKKYLADFWN